MTVDLSTLRPDPGVIDAEFSPTRRAALLADVLDQTATVRRRRPNPRRRLVLVAASAVVLTGVGALSAPMLQRLPGGDLRPVQGQRAAAADLDDLARQAALRTTAVDVGPGQYLAAVTVDQQSGRPQIRHESFTMADGWTWRKDTERGHHTWFLYPTSGQLDIRNLPSDPDQLEATLRQQELGTRSDEQGLFKLIGEIAGSETAPAEVRAASLHVLAEMAERPPVEVGDPKGGSTAPKVTVLEGRLSGQPATGARLTDSTRPGAEITYWFDPNTAELLRTDQHRADGSTFVNEVRSRTIVNDLPDPIKNKLGTDKVEKIEK